MTIKKLYNAIQSKNERVALEILNADPRTVTADELVQSVGNAKCEIQCTCTALALAIQKKLPAVVDAILKYKPRLNTPAKSCGHTPLQVAGISGQLDLFKKLVNLGADFRVERKVQINAYSSTLNIAIASKQNEIVKYLVEELKADINAKDEHGDAPIHAAVSAGLSFVRYLVEERKADYTVVASDRLTPFLLAVGLCRQDVVDYFLKFPTFDPSFVASNGATALFMAVKSERLDLVKRVRKVEISKKHFIEAFLSSFKKKNSLELVKFFIEEMKADMTAEDINGDAAFDYAAEHSAVDTLKYLRTQDKTPDNTFKYTKALTAALSHDKLENVKYLVEECHADINFCNKDINLLAAASKAKTTAGLEYLLEQKISQETIKKSAGRALRAAIEIDQEDERKTSAVFSRPIDNLRFLVERFKVDVNSTDDYGYAPWELAIASDSLLAIKYLHEKGADMKKPSIAEGYFDNPTPVRVAVRNDRLDIVRYLVEEVKVELPFHEYKGQLFSELFITPRMKQYFQGKRPKAALGGDNSTVKHFVSPKEIARYKASEEDIFRNRQIISHQEEKSSIDIAAALEKIANLKLPLSQTEKNQSFSVENLTAHKSCFKELDFLKNRNNFDEFFKKLKKLEPLTGDSIRNLLEQAMALAEEQKISYQEKIKSKQLSLISKETIESKEVVSLEVKEDLGFSRWKNEIEKNNFFGCTLNKDKMPELKLLKYSSQLDKQKSFLEKLVDDLNEKGLSCEATNEKIIFKIPYTKIKPKIIAHCVKTLSVLNEKPKDSSQKVPSESKAEVLKATEEAAQEASAPVSEKEGESKTEPDQKAGSPEKIEDNSRQTAQPEAKKPTITIVFPRPKKPEEKEIAAPAKKIEEKPKKEKPKFQQPTGAIQDCITNGFDCIANMLLLQFELDKEEKMDDGLFRAIKHFSTLFYLVRCFVMFDNAKLLGQGQSIEKIRHELAHHFHFLLEAEELVSRCSTQLIGKKLPKACLNQIPKKYQKDLAVHFEKAEEKETLINQDFAHNFLSALFSTKKASDLSDVESKIQTILTYINEIMKSFKKACGKFSTVTWLAVLQESPETLSKLAEAHSASISATAILLAMCVELEIHLKRTLNKNEKEFFRLCRHIRRQLAHNGRLTLDYSGIVRACSFAEKMSATQPFSKTYFAQSKLEMKSEGKPSSVGMYAPKAKPPQPDQNETVELSLEL